MSDPTTPGLSDQAESLRRREVSSRELVQQSLAAIEASQTTLGAFRCVRAEAALAAADDADRRLQAGERAPLLGIPVAIKDDLDLGLLGPAESEAELISLAAQLEQVERWHEHRPPVKVSGRTTDGSP